MTEKNMEMIDETICRLAEKAHAISNDEMTPMEVAKMIKSMAYLKMACSGHDSILMAKKY